MTEKSPSPRARLIREAVVLQVKLLADGLRDALLVPVSLGATILGLLRSPVDPDLEFRKVIKLGRRTERWINLFGHHRPLPRGAPTGTLDVMLDRVEEVVMEQYRKGRSAEEARAAIKQALDDGPRES